MFIAIPLHLVRDDLIFWLRAADYNRIVEMVDAEEITPDRRGIAQIPISYSYLTACQGQIAIERTQDVTKILFFTYLGAMGEVGGYMYRSDGLPPEDTDLSRVPWRPTTYSQKRPYWYKIYSD